MALGTDDIKTAHRANLFGNRTNLLLIFFVQLHKGFAGFEDFGVLRIGIRGGFADELFGKAHTAHLRFCHIFGITAQHNIGTASGHVGGDGYGAFFTGLRNDFGFLFMVLRVEYFVLYAAALEHVAENLGLFDGDGTNQHRLSFFVVLLHILDHSVKFGLLRLIDDIGQIFTRQRTVGGDFYHVQLVDLAEFLLFGHGRTGHTREL